MIAPDTGKSHFTSVALAVAAALLTTGPATGSGPRHPALAVKLDRSEADAALAIIDTLNKGAEPSDAQLAALYHSRPYERLHERESSMNRPFTDAEFTAYLRSDPVRAEAPRLGSLLSRWTDAAIAAAAERALAYLPAGSTFRATIFPMIKIKPNTFVFDLDKDPSLFYALNPDEPPVKFANTLAHEMNHIGLAQNCPVEKLPGTPGVQAMRRWVGSFGEGLAMLAAAGGPNFHPHAESSAKERALWDSEAAKFGDYVRQQNGFFRSVVAGTAGDQQTVDKAMFGYFGEAQGPWYTVGYRMAVTIERNLGRPSVVDSFCHPSKLLQTYNRAAALEQKRTGKRLAIWDPALANAIAG
jgi:hypothetical protein